MSQTTVKFQDVMEAPVTSSRTKTREGYLTVPAVLAKAGIYNYRADELGIKGKAGSDMVTVYRSSDALSKGVESFEAQPIALDHKWLTSANWRANAIGDVRNVEMHGDDMVGTLIVRDAAGIKAIDGGKTQLSNGYYATIVHRPGTYEGQAYEYEQENFIGNHTAIVDKARCGSSCRLADSDPEQKELFMATRTYDGLTVTLENEQGGQIFDRMARALEETKKERDELKAATPKVRISDKEYSSEEAQKLYDCKCQELDAAQKDKLSPEQLQKLVVERSKVMTEAVELAPDVKVGDNDTAHDIRVHVLDAILPKDATARAMWSGAFGDRKPETVTAVELAVAYPTIAAGLKKAKADSKVYHSREQLGRLNDAAATSKEEKDPRQAYMERQASSWKGKEVSKEVN